MASIANLDTMIAQAINDPNHDEVAAVSVAGSDMLRWINQVCYDASILTDCLQFTGTVTGNGTAESFALPAATAASGAYGANTPSVYWRTLNVLDRVNGRKYLPIPRDQYQDHYIAIVSNSASGLYVYNVFRYGSSRNIYLLPIVANNVAVTIEFSETHPDIAYSAGTETPRGILNQYDRLIVEGVKTLYYQTIDDEQQAQISFTVYMDWIKRLAQEVGTNPSIGPEMSSLYRQFYKAIKAVKES